MYVPMVVCQAMTLLLSASCEELFLIQTLSSVSYNRVDNIL